MQRKTNYTPRIKKTKQGQVYEMKKNISFFFWPKEEKKIKMLFTDEMNEN